MLRFLGSRSGEPKFELEILSHRQLAKESTTNTEIGPMLWTMTPVISDILLCQRASNGFGLVLIQLSLRLGSALGNNRIEESSKTASLRPLLKSALTCAPTLKKAEPMSTSTMALRLNKLLRNSIHKQKKRVNEYGDDDDDDADNISLCSDVDRSARNLADMMMPLDSYDMINTQVQCNATFQAYNFVTDDASEDSDISDDDCFGEDTLKDHEPEPTSSTTASDENSLGSDDSDKEDLLPNKPAQFSPEKSLEPEVAGITWIEGSNETRHLELQILPRPATTSTRSSGRHSRSSRSSSCRNKHSGKERSSQNDQRVGADGKFSGNLESSSRHSRRTASRREACTTGSRHKDNSNSSTSNRMKHSGVRRASSNRDGLLGGLDNKTVDNATKADPDGIGIGQSNHSHHHRLRHQQPRRDFVPRRTKSSHCRLQDSNASLDW